MQKSDRLKPFIATFLVLLLDQISKLWIRSSMTVGESLPMIGEDFFRLTYVENSGVAFGLQAGGPIFLSLFNIIAAMLLIYLLMGSSASERWGVDVTSRLPRWAIALVLAGALGNLIDRIAFGRVTDFLDFDFPDFIMSRWPTFNVADSAVTIGITLWCFSLLFSQKTRQNVTSETPAL